MHADPPHADFDFAARVNRFYAALISFAPRFSSISEKSEPSLGGKLFYAMDLDQQGRALVVASNIAGAASLAATADLAAQKQAVRDGVVDFLVNSLDEALRILKNEVRKREAVAVCVAATPDAIEREMLERGVLPDLIPPADAPNGPNVEAFLNQGACRIGPGDASQQSVLVGWQVSAAPVRWLPLVDAIALECLAPEDQATMRWLRLAPRYMGRLAQNQRLARMNQVAAKAFQDRVSAAVESRTLGVEVTVSLL